MAEVEKPKPEIKLITQSQHVRPIDVPSYEAVGWSVVQCPYRDRVEGKVLIERDFRVQ